MKRIKTIALILLLISLFSSIDLGLNFLYNLVPEHLDGYTSHSILQGLFGILGDHGWSLSKFYSMFETSIWFTYLMVVVNIILNTKTRKGNTHQ